MVDHTPYVSIYVDTWPLTPVQTRLVSVNEVLMRQFPIPFTLLSMVLLSKDVYVVTVIPAVPTSYDSNYIKC